MKKSDIAMIIMVASISMGIAYAVAQSIPFLKVSEDGEKVKTIESISADVTEPDSKVFYKGAINPTVKVVIGSTESQ